MIINPILFSDGAGVTLNIVAYESEYPSTAATDTIGIISSTSVTGYSIGTTAPATGLVDGLVWIKTGSYSPAPISLTDRITIYPLKAEQCQSGVWVEVTARVFQNGEWVSLQKRLYTSVDGTGTQNVSWSALQHASINDSAGYIQLGDAGTSSANGKVRTTYTVDFTDYSTIKFDAERLTTDTAGGFYYLVTDELNVTVGNAIIYGQYKNKARNILSLDVSSITGNHYVGFITMQNSNIRHCNIYNCWLEG